jgi:hypothetical protein
MFPEIVITLYALCDPRLWSLTLVTALRRPFFLALEEICIEASAGPVSRAHCLEELNLVPNRWIGTCVVTYIALTYFLISKRDSRISDRDVKICDAVLQFCFTICFHVVISYYATGNDIWYEGVLGAREATFFGIVGQIFSVLILFALVAGPSYSYLNTRVSTLTAELNARDNEEKRQRIKKEKLERRERKRQTRENVEARTRMQPYIRAIEKETVEERRTKRDLLEAHFDSLNVDAVQKLSQLMKKKLNKDILRAAGTVYVSNMTCGETIGVAFDLYFSPESFYTRETITQFWMGVPLEHLRYALTK